MYLTNKRIQFKFKYLIFKIIVFFLFRISNPILLYFLSEDCCDQKFRTDEKKFDYLKEFNNLSSKYKKDFFLNSFLKEISLVSYDFSHQLKKDNNEIHILINMNNKYIYPTLVSINSALKNSNKNKNTLVYHVLCPNDIRRSFLKKLKSLLNFYPKNLIIVIYSMGNLFNRYKGSRFSEVTFYRLLSPIFIPLKKIIYLDSDVLVFKDLEEMYNLSFNNNYILGILDYLSFGTDYLGLNSEKYINAGVLLINLEKIRKDNKYYEMLYMYKTFKKLNNNDQTIINYVLYPNIGKLPPKFGIFNFNSIFDIKYLYLQKIRQNMNLTEIINAFKDPVIIHYTLCNPKVWYSNSKFVTKYTREGTIKKLKCQKYHSIWIESAKNTSFYDEIAKFYKIKR